MVHCNFLVFNSAFGICLHISIPAAHTSDYIGIADVVKERFERAMSVQEQRLQFRYSRTTYNIVELNILQHLKAPPRIPC